MHLETVSPTTLGGFRGMGEGGTIGAPAAIANAVADALSPLGIEINELPVTPERLFRLIDGGKATSDPERRVSMDLGLNGKVALVTGAARDVGREIALTLAAKARRSRSTTARRPRRRERSSAEIAASGRQGEGLQAPTSPTSPPCKAMVGDDREGLRRRSNILVNNAGLAKRQRFVETTPDDWQQQIDTCLYGAIHCCHAAAPHLESGKNGRIISLIGDSSRVGESGLAIVAAARAGVVALMKSLAREFGRSGTTANAVSLGLVETAHDKRLGRGEPREAGAALSGAPARPGRRRRADGGAARLAARAAGSPARCSASAAASAWFDQREAD